MRGLTAEIWAFSKVPALLLGGVGFIAAVARNSGIENVPIVNHIATPPDMLLIASLAFRENPEQAANYTSTLAFLIYALFFAHGLSGAMEAFLNRNNSNNPPPKPPVTPH